MTTLEIILFIVIFILIFSLGNSISRIKKYLINDDEFVDDLTEKINERKSENETFDEDHND